MRSNKWEHASNACSANEPAKSIASFFVSSFGSVKGCLLGVVFSAACSFSLTFPLYASGRSLAACVVLALPLLIVLTIALSVIVRLSFKLDKCQEIQNNHVRLFIFATVSFIAIWIVFGLLPLYPGCYSTDSVDILKMISGLPFESDHFRYDALNNHHPAAYIFFVSVIFKACSIFGLSKFACAAVISFAHLVILGLCCGFIVYKVSRLFNRPIITLFCFSFLLCDPLLVWYSVTVWKDVIFSGLFACFALLLVDIKVNSKQYANHLQKLIPVLLIALGCSLLRSNGFIAVVAALVLFIFFMSEDMKKYIAGLTVCVVVAYGVVTGPIYSFANISPAHFSETVGVPLQQMAKVIHDEGDLSEEDEAFLSNILPLDSWKALYTESTPNAIKFAPSFNDKFLEDNKQDFFGTWIRLGINNPGTYVKAWISQTKDYWSLNSHTWYISKPGLEDLSEGEDYRDGLYWPISEALVNSALTMAVAAFPHLYSIGSLAWIMLLCCFIAVLKKRWTAMVFCIPFVILWGTFLLAAPANDFRYMLALHLSVPLFLLFAFCDSGCFDSKDISCSGNRCSELEVTVRD